MEGELPSISTEEEEEDETYEVHEEEKELSLKMSRADTGEDWREGEAAEFDADEG